MTRSYIPRSLEPVLKRASQEFPVVVLTGPRQSGKTTLLRHVFGKTCDYVSLEAPEVRASAAADPRGFLDLHRPPVIFDEVQYAPELLIYVKEKVDARRGEAGQYFLTGSQNLLLLERVTESLAGRAAMLRLLPLSNKESREKSRAPLPWEAGGERREESALSRRELWKALLRGNYPEIVTGPARNIALWHSSYVQTYLERDVRSLRQIGDLTLFQNFLRSLAARSGQILRLAEMARELGIAVNTARAWLSVLEAAFQVVILRPYFANIGKRLVKTPKVYFTDTGTLCYLAGLRDPEHAASGPMGGAIFETAVLAEILKTYIHRGEEPQVYFWRTASGTEVDFVVESEGKLIPIEVKLSATPKPAMAAGIISFQQDFRGKAGTGYVIHSGQIRLSLAPGVMAVPFGEV